MNPSYATTSHGILDKALQFSELGFLIYKMGILAVPTSWGGYEINWGQAITGA